MEPVRVTPARRGFLPRLMQSAAAWTFLGTFLRLGANVLVLPLILKKLPPEQLGRDNSAESLGR